ncbi:MAG TPA: hypothetical protein VF195_13055 [Actinomycetota bacterium]
MKDLKKVLVSLTISAMVLAGILVATQAPSWGRHDLPSFSHEQLEADRVMTQQMGTDVGPSMAVQMPGDGMLKRSSSEAYVEALEQHTRTYNKMAGLTP